MSYRLSRHAESELERRQILKSWPDRLLDAPEQRIQQTDDTEILQSRFATEEWENVSVEGGSDHG